ncbi:lytic transglycosylase domain-containing protein [Novosphingobium rosa]|uniref:lytic transglycosylase domain-containing protein n=1 Tax=Novosphingobium rosa TaxID=76978 RepID=UPI0009FC747D|nr:lytic transglycosylase domain-containing protein [Novosphingobium rosa]
MKFQHFAIPAALLLVPCQAQAGVPRRAHDELAVGHCIRQAAKGNLWLEMTLWGLRDQEAGQIGTQVQNTNGSYDLGILQINTSWVPSVARLVRRSPDQVRLWLQFDPCFNAETARWIFLTAIGQTGDFWKAVGAYHSPTPWRQRRYAFSVANHLRRRYGDRLFLQSHSLP